MQINIFNSTNVIYNQIYIPTTDHYNQYMNTQNYKRLDKMNEITMD